MRKTFYRKINKKSLAKWHKDKEWEWKRNADFWIKIMREKLDPFRTYITDRAILKSLPPQKSAHILDVGCGEGYLARKLAKRGYHVWGVDFSSRLIQAARDLEQRNPLGIRYEVGDLRKTRFLPGFFDCIVSNQTIHEIPDPSHAFREFFRILKKKGYLLLLFLHPCFDISPKESQTQKSTMAELYFQHTKIKKEYYLVGGVQSPAPYFYLHLPLSRWIQHLIDAGFCIENIKEPSPPRSLLKKSAWWRENFRVPRFILIEASKPPQRTSRRHASVLP